MIPLLAFEEEYRWTVSDAFLHPGLADRCRFTTRRGRRFTVITCQLEHDLRRGDRLWGDRVREEYIALADRRIEVGFAPPCGPENDDGSQEG